MVLKLNGNALRIYHKAYILRKKNVYKEKKMSNLKMMYNWTQRQQTTLYFKLNGAEVALIYSDP